jgi:hypothetical protein
MASDDDGRQSAEALTTHLAILTGTRECLPRGWSAPYSGANSLRYGVMMLSRFRLGMCAVASVYGLSGALVEAAPAANACTLFTRAEMKAFSADGMYDLVSPREERTATGSACHYPGVMLAIDPFPFSMVETERSKARADYEHVPGLGDSAYFRGNTPSGRIETYVRSGQRVLIAQVSVGRQETRDAARNRLLALTRAALAKLR